MPLVGRVLITGLALNILGSCTEQAPPNPAPVTTAQAPEPPTVTPPPSGQPIEAEPSAFKLIEETGDLAEIRQRGVLRILSPTDPIAPPETLPRIASALQAQFDIAADFAHSLSLEPVHVRVPSFALMVPMLLSGEADLIASNLTITDDRREFVDFSTPFDEVSFQIITRSDDQTLNSWEDLNGRRIASDPSSAFWPALQQLKEQVPNLILEKRPLTPTAEWLDQIASGDIDISIHQSNILASHLAYRDDIRVALTMPQRNPVAWAVRKDSPNLRAQLNRYLDVEKLSATPKAIHHDDWAGIKSRKTIRYLMRNNAASYFLWRGSLVGYEYELAREFAKRHDLRLEVVVPPDHESLFQWLIEGRGDVAAGFLFPTEREDGSVLFSKPYHHAEIYLIAREDDPIESPVQLLGRRIAVRRSSAYWDPLRNMQAAGIGLVLEEVPADAETDQLILGVAQGEYDLTVAGGPVRDVNLSALGPVRRAFALTTPQANAWAVRADAPGLQQKLNEYVSKEFRKTFFNVVYRKYFRSQRRLSAHVEEGLVADKDGQLSPWDPLVKKYAKEYGLDWRLIVSQMYQESGFNPGKVSWAGAMGLMQVMPKTGKQLGISDLFSPEENVHAGVKYLDWLRKRFDDDLPYTERIWFTMASYNAGLGHVIDARKLARQKGLNPNRWFDNVEQAMLLLSHPDYYKKARHGFVRGKEPVNYVRSIRNRYQAYVSSQS